MKTVSTLKMHTEVKNLSRVPAKAWNAWGETARRTFNRVYDFMMNNQKLMTHPGQPAFKPAHWKTIAWNAAWIAADAVDGSLPVAVVTERKRAA